MSEPNQPSGDSSADDPLVGSLVDGKYRITHRIARGGMSRVYAAVQLPVERVVAIKVLHPRRADAERNWGEQFMREASIYAKLRHPNTVTLHDYGVLDTGALYMVMELVEGRNLAQELRNGPLSPGRVLRIAYEICRSLQEAHEFGIVHRDLKPANIMLTQRSEGEAVKVLDFGIAAEVDSVEGGDRLGTPRYMAPEQIQHGAIDPRADLYSLGVLMFELLAGQPPFRSERRSDVVRAHLFQPAPPLNEVADQPLPPALVHLVASLLEKAPDARPPSAAVVRRHLHAIMADLRGTPLDPTGSLGVLGSQRNLTPMSVLQPVEGQPPVASPFRRVLQVFAVAALFSLGLGGIAAAAVLMFLLRPAPPSSVGTPSAAVELVLRSTPPGATVFDGERALGVTPVAVPLPPGESLRLELRLEGYASYELVQGPSAVSVTHDVVLVPVPASPPVGEKPSPQRRPVPPERPRRPVFMER